VRQVSGVCSDGRQVADGVRQHRGAASLRRQRLGQCDRGAVVAGQAGGQRHQRARVPHPCQVRQQRGQRLQDAVAGQRPDGGGVGERVRDPTGQHGALAQVGAQLVGERFGVEQVGLR
jgi:hypothetical protein